MDGRKRRAGRFSIIPTRKRMVLKMHRLSNGLREIGPRKAQLTERRKQERWTLASSVPSLEQPLINLPIRREPEQT